MPPLVELYVENQTNGLVSDADVQDFCSALQHQIAHDVAPFWGITATVVFLAAGQPLPEKGWRLTILLNSDQAGALGYHELTPTGMPQGLVFAQTSIDAGDSWTVTASHEGLEMLIDPWASLCADPGDGKIYALEICDACEDDSFGYNIKAASGKEVLMSDFVTPGWFITGTNMWNQFDYKSHITAPLEILQNGYIGYLTTDDNWQQLDGAFSSDAKKAMSVPQPGHRRQKRAIGHKNWQKSTR